MFYSPSKASSQTLIILTWSTRRRQEDPFQALASPDDLEEMGDQPPPPNTARNLDGTDWQRLRWLRWFQADFFCWNMWGWRWILRNTYIYMYNIYDICARGTTTTLRFCPYVFAFFGEGIGGMILAKKMVGNLEGLDTYMQSYSVTLHALHTLHTLKQVDAWTKGFRKDMETIPKWRRIHFL